MKYVKLNIHVIFRYVDIDDSMNINDYGVLINYIRTRDFYARHPVTNSLPLSLWSRLIMKTNSAPVYV